MNSDGSPFSDVVSGIDPLWDELARDHRELTALAPVLRHLVWGESNPLLGEELVARTRGMLDSLAVELLRSCADAIVPAQRAEAVAALTDAPDLLGHVHVLAVEGQIVVRLADLGIDPLLPPLVQDRIASVDPLIAALAMNLMAAQTRFVRRQHRMELSSAELPADLLHEALRLVGRVIGPQLSTSLDLLRADYDERRGRLGILAQLGLGLGDDFTAALDPVRAGFSLFATALSLVTGHQRDAVVLAAARPHSLRLALLLAAAGLEPAARASVMMGMHPDTTPPPEAWLRIEASHAADLLAQDQSE